MVDTTSKYRIFPDYAKEGGYELNRTGERYDYRLVSVDPGGAHVGVCCFGRDEAGKWACFWAAEMTPLQFEDWLSEQMVYSTIDILVVEQFTLYPDKAMAQTGSDMPTSQLIGVIKYIHRHMAGVAARWPRPDVELVLQPASIQKPTLGILKRRKVQSTAKKMRAGEHALSAELHGYYYILEQLKEPLAA